MFCIRIYSKILLMLKPKSIFALMFFALSIVSCDKQENIEDINCLSEGFFLKESQRNFRMGFTSWNYGPELADVADTYQFISNNGDIYTEHIDHKIPWNAWINGLNLPNDFTDEIDFKLSNRIKDKPLLLSVSLLNTDRNELSEDVDGSIPVYTSFADEHIKNAYFKHLDYLISRFNPNYVCLSIEFNELYINDISKWEGYKLLMSEIRKLVRAKYPTLPLSESITLHNFYKPNINGAQEYQNELTSYINSLDFAAISHYPFFKDQHSKPEFQGAFDFLHQRVNNTIAFVETSSIAENLIIPGMDVNISTSECEQNAYLETLLENAQDNNYEFIIWWSHRDYDAIWQTFPDKLKDIGQIWRDSGLLSETGFKRPAYYSWQKAYSVPLAN